MVSGFNENKTQFNKFSDGQQYTLFHFDHELSSLYQRG